MTLRIALAAAGGLLLGASAALAADPVKIGYVTTLTGPTAVIGNDMRDAVELALDHVGRKAGGRELQVIYEDDALKPEVGKQKAEKLLQSDKVDFISGFIWSNVLLAAYKPIIDSETFLVSSNAGPSQIAGKQCSKWFFSTSWNNDQIPEAMGELLNKKGVKKLYIMSPNYAAGRDMAAGVKRTFKGEVVGEDLTKWPDQLDFSAELSKIRAAKPDAAFAFYPGAAGGQFVTQYLQAGLKEHTPLYTTYTVDELSLPILKEKGLDIAATMWWAVNRDTPANKKFVADFLAKHKRFPSFYAAQAYESILLIHSAVEAVKGDLKDKAKVGAALKAADFASLRGKLKFGPNHFPVQDFFQTRAVQTADGKYAMEIVDTVFKDREDSHAAECKMN